MAMEPNNTVQPDATLVRSYTVERMGHPRVRVAYSDVVRFMYSAAVESAAADANNEFTTLTVASPDPMPVESWVPPVVGDTLETDAGVVLGTVVAWDGDTRTITLDSGPTTDPTGTTVMHPRRNHLGQQMYKPVRYEWASELSTGDVEQRSYMIDMMFTVMQQIVTDALNEMGQTFTQEDVDTAVQSMMQRGQWVDSYLTKAGEQLELDRQSGAVSVMLSGRAP